LQKRLPTSFHLFPNAREVVLKPFDTVYRKKAPASYVSLHLDVPALFRLPAAPADAAAARAALAGMTLLGVLGGEPDPGLLAAALLHLPGLRAVELSCGECDAFEFGGPDALGSRLVDVLAGCPRLESLKWNLGGLHLAEHRGHGCAGGDKRGRGATPVMFKGVGGAQFR
jgi:hypothetical protein